jgi:sugar/nucleoside kinase (ribokinase family)
MTKIVGIGNALVDVIVSLPDETLFNKFGLKKGGMEMIDQETKRTIHADIKEFSQVIASGGSTSNTIHGLARLGASTGYIGKIGNDKAGMFFKDELRQSNITDHLIYSDIDTGIANTLMTSDAERTFATYLGAASTMQPDEIDYEIFNDYDNIMVEGYLIFNRNLIVEVCRLAKEKGLKIAMDMASYNLVNLNRDFIKELLENYVDIIFANEEEAFAFTNKNEWQALEELSKYCEVAVVKLGSRGSIANIKGEIIAFPAYKANCVDTNGAGDIYAAGFLYGLIHNMPVSKIGKLASRLSGELVETIGAKLSTKQWEKLLLECDKY